MGKSIGSGPATHLASHRNPRGLILITPYTSIRDCVVDLLGSFFKYLVAEKFRNIDKIDKVFIFIFVNNRLDVQYVIFMERKII